VGVVFIVRRARGGTFGYWLRSLAAFGVPDDDRDAPAVIARSASGPDHVLLRTGTYRQALRAKDRFSRELDALGESEFRRRYGLPERPA
jgi:hypothetical protein